MDNRKLRHLPGTTLILDESNFSKPFAEAKSERSGPRKPARDNAAEIVHRWNAHNALRDALSKVLDAGTVDLDQACKDARALLKGLEKRC
jgi:hypothetical protein